MESSLFYSRAYRRRRAFFLCAGILTALLTVAGCTNTPTKKNARLKTLRSRLPYDPPSLDPRKGSEPIASAVHFMLFEGLTKMSARSTRELALAKQIDISKDRTLYTFHLRDSFWSDGHPVTAHDFVYSWQSMLDPLFACPNAHLLYPIKNAKKAKKGKVPLNEIGVKALDDHTLQVQLEHPTPYFLDLTSFCVFFPIPKHIVEKNPQWADNAGNLFVTNGPFTLSHWKIGNELLFVRNEKFWKSESIYLDQMRFYIIRQEMTALGMFETGDLDLVCNISSTDWIPHLSKQGKLKCLPVGGTTFISFNVNLPPFSNRHIRKAFSESIHRQLIVDNITQFGEPPALGFIPPCLKKNTDGFSFSDGSKQKARKHFLKGLEELGLEKSDFEDIPYYYINDDLHKKVAQSIQMQIQETLGIKLKLVEREYKILLDKLTKRNYRIMQCLWVAQYNDRMNILDRFKFKSNPKNYPDWENSDFTELLNRSVYAETEEERIALLEKAEAIMGAECPLAPIYHWNLSYLQQPYVEGFFYSPIGSFHTNEIRFSDPS